MKAKTVHLPSKISPENSLSGILMMCSGIAFLGINDVFAKMLADLYSPLQILFLRNTIALPVAIVLTLYFQGVSGLRSSAPKIHLLRSFFWVMATITFFTSIKYLGLAKSTALLSIAPLIVVVIAATFLKEPTGWKRWASVLIGFIGAMIIIRPGMASFEIITLLPLITALMAAFLMLSARFVDERESVWTLLLYLTGASTIISALVVPFVWIPVSASDIWLFFGVALFGTAGMLFITQAFRIAPAIVVAPFDYTAVIWATVFGWMFWNEIPDHLTILGAIIIVLSGLATTFLRYGAVERQQDLMENK